MTGKSKKRSDERTQQQAPETPQRDASSESKEQSSERPSEHRYRSQRTDLLEGDPAGTAYSEEMGHTPTRE